MSTAQTNIETLIIALIKTQSPFASPSTIPVVAGDTDTNLVTQPDRVTVESQDPTPEVAASAPFRNAPVMSAMVDVSAIMTSADTTTLDTWMLAIETALASAPSSVITTATTLFPRGFQVDAVSETSRDNSGAKQRTKTKTFKVVYCP